MSSNDDPQALFDTLADEKLVAKLREALRIEQLEGLLALPEILLSGSIPMNCSISAGDASDLFRYPEGQELFHDPDFVEHVALLKMELIGSVRVLQTGPEFFHAERVLPLLSTSLHFFAFVMVSEVSLGFKRLLDDQPHGAELDRSFLLLALSSIPARGFGHRSARVILGVLVLEVQTCSVRISLAASHGRESPRLDVAVAFHLGCLPPLRSPWLMLRLPWSPACSILPVIWPTPS